VSSTRKIAVVAGVFFLITEITALPGGFSTTRF